MNQCQKNGIDMVFCTFEVTTLDIPVQYHYIGESVLVGLTMALPPHKFIQVWRSLPISRTRSNEHGIISLHARMRLLSTNCFASQTLTGYRDYSTNVTWVIRIYTEHLKEGEGLVLRQSENSFDVSVTFFAANQLSHATFLSYFMV